jgi:hypothetical protein
LFTHEFAKHAHHATGIDFVPRNFETAKKWKALHNTTYLLGDVTAPLEQLIGRHSFPNKFLQQFSLAYFSPSQFDAIIRNILEHLASENRWLSSKKSVR